MNLMRIGIDARFAVRNRRGIGNYTLKLIQELAGIDFQNEYVLYIDHPDHDGVLPQKTNFKVKRLSPSNYLIWEQVVLPIQTKMDAIDLLHCTGNTAPIWIDKRIKLVSSIMDVMYLKDYSELPRSTSWYQRAGRHYRKNVVPRTVHRISRVLTISEFSKNDILRHMQALEADQVKVVYLSSNATYRLIDKVSAAQEIFKRYGIKDKYVFALGGMDPRKNTEMVIRKFIELKREHSIEEKLVIAGIPNWRETPFIDILKGSDYRDDFIFLDYVSEEDLALLYNAASVFLYPSLYEGFGIPPLEAMSCGVPVITSNTTSIPEVVGDAAIQIDPANGQELKAAIIRLTNDLRFRDVLIKRGLEQAGKYSWKRMALETLTVYNEVYGEGKK